MLSTGCATLGVARLSIVDRAAAKQPMAFELGGKQGLIAYNGEVYNFMNLRKEFVDRGIRFANNSDTELVLAAYAARAPRPVLFDGMFAYAVWDAACEELILVRDRLGIKPLFYVDFGDAFLFASEPKGAIPPSTPRPKSRSHCDAGVLPSWCYVRFGLRHPRAQLF